MMCGEVCTNLMALRTANKVPLLRRQSVVTSESFDHFEVFDYPDVRLILTTAGQWLPEVSARPSDVTRVFYLHSVAQLMAFH